jgi:hypothetical protein
VTIAAGTLKYTQNNACLYNWQEILTPGKDQHIQFSTSKGLGYLSEKRH